MHIINNTSRSFSSVVLKLRFLTKIDVPSVSPSSEEVKMSYRDGKIVYYLICTLFESILQ